MRQIKYFIGEYYRYPKSRQQYKLISVNDWRFNFECGHWCTDNVFLDLIRIKTNKQVCDDLQLELFN
jgi:hypothetical protein